MTYKIHVLIFVILVSCVFTSDVPENVDDQKNPVQDVNSSDPDGSDIFPKLVIDNDTQRSIEVNKSIKFTNCIPYQGPSVVRLMNDTELIRMLVPQGNVTNRDVASDCVLVLFYSKSCPFSRVIAPFYNVLPRFYPDINMVAINAMAYPLFNRQNGIVGVPSLVFFHNGRAVAKYNGSEYDPLYLNAFLTANTGIWPRELDYVNSVEFFGPVYSTGGTTLETDLYLSLSWLFIIGCAGYYFTKSRMWTWIVETVQRNWRESEAHAEHAHTD